MKAINHFWMLLAAMLLLNLLAPARAEGRASGYPDRPNARVAPDKCVTSDCHPSVKSSPTIHGPVAANACESCHESVDVSKHTFLIRREKAELCTYCHDFDVSAMPEVHKPVKLGECLGCHDPHGGSTRAMLREKSVADLCRRCHENVLHGKTFIHGPAAQGACDACHPPHAARFPKLLDLVGADLCLACHRELEAPLASAKDKHKALEQGCVKCHDVHGSNTPMNLVQAVPDLCLSCHDKLKDKIAAATVVHSPVIKDRACMTCHTAHVSNLTGLIANLPAIECLKCHDKPVKNQHGDTIAAVPEVADPKLYKHGELKDGRCGGCHDVHGGQRPLLLTKPYSKEFYWQFDVDDFAFCFGCHESQLAQAKATTKATNFRNGERNLHFAHAGEGSHDHNCRVCHLAHAATSDRLIRPTVQFGKWENMPVAFSRTESGGTCAAGCHGQYRYDRTNPVPATGRSIAATRPATAHALHDDTRIIRWTSKDAAGATFTIPSDPPRPIALALLSAADPALESTVERFRDLASMPGNAQFIIVVSGADAQQRVARLKPMTLGHFVSDPDSIAPNALGIRGWPLVLVLQPEGQEIARLTGAPDVLAMKLGPYLNLAAGNVDANRASELLATTPVADSTPQLQALRSERIIRTLLNANRPQEALAFMEHDPLNITPTGKMLRAEALVQLERPNDAMAILDGLPKDLAASIPARVLRARTLLALKKWSDAKILLAPLATGSATRDIHLLMGEIYSHEQNWPMAAAEYRAALGTGEKNP